MADDLDTERCKYCGGETFEEYDELICKVCDKSNGLARPSRDT